MLTEDEVRESLRVYSGGRMIRDPSEAEVRNKMRRLEQEQQKPIQAKKPEHYPFRWSVRRYPDGFPSGAVRCSGYAEGDDPEAVAESVKQAMASGLTGDCEGYIGGGIALYGMLDPCDPPYKILVYKLATVLEVEA